MIYTTHTFSWTQPDLLHPTHSPKETTLGGVHSIRPLSPEIDSRYPSLPITDEPLWKTISGTTLFFILWIAALCLA
jgi:hypothetical protein